MSRTPIIAGNWKMHNTIAEATALVNALKQAGNKNNAEIIIAPSYTALAVAANTAKGSEIKIAAQDVHWEDKGAFTSAVSPVQAKEAGATHTIIGHSERRSVFGDTDEILNKKVAAALRHNLTVIFCVGETLAEREANKTLDVISAQLENGLKGFTAEQLKGLVIAYEPVWSIGPGKTPAGKDYITMIARFVKERTGGIDVVYGGGLKKDNAAMLASIPEIDGGLIALTRFQGEIGFYPDEYLEIIRTYLGH